MATARRLPQFQGQVTQLEGAAQNLRAVLPEEKDVADILHRVQGLATQSNLTIQRFTPQDLEAGSDVRDVPFKLKAEGTYHDLGFFFDRISKFPRIINVGDISIKAKQPPQRGRDDRRGVHRHHLRAPGWAGAGAGGGRRVPKQPSAQIGTAACHRVHAALAVVIVLPRPGPRPAAGRTAAPPAAAPAAVAAVPAPPTSATPTAPTVGATRSSAWSAAATEPRDADRRRWRPGLLINEISIKGMIRDRPASSRWSSRRTTRPTSSGTAAIAWTATVKAIIQDGVVFSQDVNDPLSLVKQREIPGSGSAPPTAAVNRNSWKEPK